MRLWKRVTKAAGAAFAAFVAIAYGLDQAAAPIVLPLLTGHTVVMGETISGGCGRVLATLNPDDPFCRAVCAALDVIDDNHCTEAYTNEFENPRYHGGVADVNAGRLRVAARL